MARPEPVVDVERVLVVHRAELNALNPRRTQYPALAIGPAGPPLLLINGLRQASFGIRGGSRERWRILNLAADVQQRLSLSPQPARVGGWHDRRRTCSGVLVSHATTLPAARLDLQIGLFTRGQQITLDAVFAGDSGANLDRQLLTGQAI